MTRTPTLFRFVTFSIAFIACGGAAPSDRDNDMKPSGGGGGGSSSQAGSGSVSQGGAGGTASPAGNTGTGGSPAAGGSTQPAAACAATAEPDALLGDFESGTAKVLEVGGRSGSWFLYDDGTAGAMQTPAKEVNKPLVAEMPGACGSMFAFHTKGSGFMTWAGLGANLAPKTAAGTKGSYNVSAYKGVAFRAKAAAPTLVRVAFADKNSDPDGAVCVDTTDRMAKNRCFDHFSKDVTIGTAWTDYTIRFTELAQKGFGYSAPGLDLANVYSFFLQARGDAGKTLSFDLWFDDVRFVK